MASYVWDWSLNKYDDLSASAAGTPATGWRIARRVHHCRYRVSVSFSPVE